MLKNLAKTIIYIYIYSIVYIVYILRLKGYRDPEVFSVLQIRPLTVKFILMLVCQLEIVLVYKHSTHKNKADIAHNQLLITYYMMCPMVLIPFSCMAYLINGLAPWAEDDVLRDVPGRATCAIALSSKRISAIPSSSISRSST